MSLTEQIITIVLAVLAVQLTRLVPFWVFPANRPVPEYIRYLGKVLPAAMFGMLVVYCYKDINFTTAHSAIPEFIASTIVLVFHLWKRNIFISITAGTGVYMLLVQRIFI